MKLAVKLQPIILKAGACTVLRGKDPCTKLSRNLWTFTRDANVISLSRSKDLNLRTKTFFKRPLSCWSCGCSSEGVKFCPNCQTILPFDDAINYFQILDLHKQYEVDTKVLSSKLRKLQSLFHPDKYSMKLEKEEKLAQEHSSMINKAFQTLSHPVKRAEYLLYLAGRPLEEGELTMDPVFLMEIMEVNEKLADAEDKETIYEISRVNEQIMNNLISQANLAFVSDDIILAREIVAKMKYFNNIYEKVKKQELKFGIVH